MYIESKGDDVSGPGRMGRVTYTKSGKGIYYKGRLYITCSGMGYKANYFDSETHERYWISGPKKRGGDRLYPGIIHIDPDVREEYWTEIRGLPEKKDQKPSAVRESTAARESNPMLPSTCARVKLAVHCFSRRRRGNKRWVHCQPRGAAWYNCYT